MAFFAAAPLLYSALAVTAVSTGVSVYSSVQQGKAAEAAGEFNAKIAEQEAAANQQRAHENIRRTRTRNRRFLSRQRALISGRGIALEGTALQILGKSASNLELEVMDQLGSADMAANKSKSQADMSRFNGQQAKGASNFQAGASLLSGFSKGLGQVQQGYDSGALGGGEE
tara:strand:- start:1651 stop:2163 length:513 start_codon:yes stop_codon:yes gene_type:complete